MERQRPRPVARPAAGLGRWKFIGQAVFLNDLDCNELNTGQQITIHIYIHKYICTYMHIDVPKKLGIPRNTWNILGSAHAIDYLIDAAAMFKTVYWE